MWKYIVYWTIILIPSLAIAQLEWEYEYEVLWTLEEEIFMTCPPEEDEFGRTSQIVHSLACVQTVYSDKRKVFPKKKDAIAFMVRAKEAGMKSIELDSMPSGFKLIRANSPQLKID